MGASESSPAGEVQRYKGGLRYKRHLELGMKRCTLGASKNPCKIRTDMY